MLSKLMEAIEKDPTLQSQLNATKKLNKLTAYEINTLKELVALLKPLKVATDELQGDFETVGNVIPAYLGLLMVSKHWTSPLTKNVAKALETSLVNRLSYVLNESCYVLGNFIRPVCLRNNLMSKISINIGAILDPRFKKDWNSVSGLCETDLMCSIKVELVSKSRKTSNVFHAHSNFS